MAPVCRAVSRIFVDEASGKFDLELVSLTALDDQTEIEFVKDMIFRHAEHTGSRRATEIILAWDQFVAKIVRVLPNDYRRALEEAAVVHV